MLLSPVLGRSVEKVLIMCNRHLAIIMATMLLLLARVAVAQDTSMGDQYVGGGYVVGGNGVASPVLGDGVGGQFVVGPNGVASPVLGDGTGRFVIGPNGVASPVIGDGN
jgi:hypothetical protein